MRIKRYSINLSAQMAACDGNFIRILKLLPNLQEGARRVIAIPGSSVVDHMVFVMEVVESFKYTSTVSISQSNSDVENPYYKRPAMTVRIYHDAATAEVITYQNHRNFRSVYPVPNRNMYQSNEKEQLNLFLTDWLNLCLHKGVSDSKLLVADQLTFADN